MGETNRMVHVRVPYCRPIPVPIAKMQPEASNTINSRAFYIHKILCICIAQTKQKQALICIYPLRLTFYLHILAAMESILHAIARFWQWQYKKRKIVKMPALHKTNIKYRAGVIAGLSKKVFWKSNFHKALLIFTSAMDDYEEFLDACEELSLVSWMLRKNYHWCLGCLWRIITGVLDA